MRVLPKNTRNWLILSALLATFLAVTIDRLLGNQIDYWVHDSALLYQKRTHWQHTAIVVLDNAIPDKVTRLQSLPLFAKAAENLINSGVKGIFMDANLSKEVNEYMPFAQCVESSGAVRLTYPDCAQSGNQCQLISSETGRAPMQMPTKILPYFRVAPYIDGQENNPDFVLYGIEASEYLADHDITAKARLIKKNSAIARWMDLSEEHAVIQLAKFIDPEKVSRVLTQEVREVCDKNLPCRRIRFSRPANEVKLNQIQPIFPLSKLAACDNAESLQTAAMLKGRVVIFQLTTPKEATDVVITPSTTALFGPHLFTPGPQYLADAVETLLANDHPREPPQLVKLLVFLFAACLGVMASAYFQQQAWLWVIAALLFLTLGALCFLSPLMQFWPVTTTLITYFVSALGGYAVHLYIGFKEGKLITQYMPQQVHNLLLSLKADESFRNQRCNAVVLMSDLAGYTTVTSMLDEPAHILDLMNDYLSETSYVLQEKYEGWLETYIGDMVCYYWPTIVSNQSNPYQNALLGALELSTLQKEFFKTLVERYKHKFDVTILDNISSVINAGIGVAAGTVVMGDLGPKRGVRKFGILGDPMNLTSRIEGLTRHFNTEIIITEEFLTETITLGFPTRRLGYFKVKGRSKAVQLFALGWPDDERFQPARIADWESWFGAIESGRPTICNCPELFLRDQDSFAKWQARGLLNNGIWCLDEK